MAPAKNVAAWLPPKIWRNSIEVRWQNDATQQLQAFGSKPKFIIFSIHYYEQWAIAWIPMIQRCPRRPHPFSWLPMIHHWPRQPHRSATLFVTIRSATIRHLPRAISPATRRPCSVRGNRPGITVSLSSLSFIEHVYVKNDVMPHLPACPNFTRTCHCHLHVAVL